MKFMHHKFKLFFCQSTIKNHSINVIVENYFVVDQYRKLILWKMCMKSFNNAIHVNCYYQLYKNTSILSFQCVHCLWKPSTIVRYAIQLWDNLMATEHESLMSDVYSHVFHILEFYWKQKRYIYTIFCSLLFSLSLYWLNINLLSAQRIHLSISIWTEK